MSKDLPLYKSHKTVRALEIKQVDGYTLVFASADYPPITVKDELFSRYMPVSGDFYVVYEDGYASISPRKAFLDGYTIVE